MLQINASIARYKSQIFCAYRTKHLYKFDSECFLSELDENLEVIVDKPLLAENNNTAFEDVRLFSYENYLLAFYTYFPTRNIGCWDWIYGMGFGIVDPETGYIRDQYSLRELSKRTHEKNWCPFMFNENLYMITDFDPYIRIIQIENIGKTTNAKEIYLSDTITKGWQFGELRGGTPLLNKLEQNSEWFYGFVHSYLTQVNGFSRFYYYTVVRFNAISKQLSYHPIPLPYVDEEYDEEYELLWQYSNNCSLKVIFPIGIMYQDKGVIVSFGKDDVCSYTQYFTWDYLENLF